MNVAGSFQTIKDPYKAKEEQQMDRDYAEAEYAAKTSASVSMASLSYERLSKTISQIGDLVDGYENRLASVLGPGPDLNAVPTAADDVVENRSRLVRDLDDANDRLGRYSRTLDVLLNRVQV